MFSMFPDVHNAEFVLTGVLTQTLDYESYPFFGKGYQLPKEVWFTTRFPELGANYLLVFGMYNVYLIRK